MAARMAFSLFGFSNRTFNADYLTRRSAAVILEDHRLNDDLQVTLNVLIENPNKLKAMRAAMFELSHPRAAEKIASVLIELAGE